MNLSIDACDLRIPARIGGTIRSPYRALNIRSRRRCIGPVWYQNPESNLNSKHPLAESVERLVVSPVFRTVPWDVERLRQQELQAKVSLLIISESDVCRSVLAAACLEQLLREAGLSEEVNVSTCGTRPYNLGDGPEPAAEAAAEALGWPLPAVHAARLFEPAADIVSHDLLLVVDKFTAGDVMREVSSFDLVNRNQQFSYKVRRLGEFRSGPPAGRVRHGLAGAGAPPQAPPAPALGTVTSCGSTGDDMDIDDPLYGNYGGEQEERAMLRACNSIRDACRGLVAFLLEVQTETRSGGFQAADGPPESGLVGQRAPVRPPLGPAVRQSVHLLGPMSWLAPPMLSARVDMEELHGR